MPTSPRSTAKVADVTAPPDTEPVIDKSVRSTSRDMAAELAAANARIAELEASVPLGIAPVEPQESALYVVTCVGVCYAVDGAPTNIALGLHGRVIQLVDSEAERLLMQGAIRAASEEDIANEVLRAERSSAAVDAQLLGPASNPYGGSLAGTTLERHAAEQMAIAKKSGAIPPDATAPGVVA